MNQEQVEPTPPGGDQNVFQEFIAGLDAMKKVWLESNQRYIYTFPEEAEVGAWDYVHLQLAKVGEEEFFIGFHGDTMFVSPLVEDE